jgi:hypothetical protein
MFYLSKPASASEVAVLTVRRSLTRTRATNSRSTTRDTLPAIHGSAFAEDESGPQQRKLQPSWRRPTAMAEEIAAGREAPAA